MSKRKKNKDVNQHSEETTTDVNLLAEKSLLAAKDFFNEGGEGVADEETQAIEMISNNIESQDIESQAMENNSANIDKGIEEEEEKEEEEEEYSLSESNSLSQDSDSDLFSVAGFGEDSLSEEELSEKSPESQDNLLDLNLQEELADSELSGYESAEIEDVEFVEEERLTSIIESILFATDKPVSMNTFKMVFKGTNIRTDKIRRALDQIAVELAGGHRGVTLEEVPGGYQLRTKIDNMNFITRSVKPRQFKVSGPALEVLAIVAYKQPLVKSEIDEIRGVESGHLLRALMEKGLVSFEGKSDLPGKPMLYGTTKKFLEIFGLRNLKELPTLSQIDELLPEGIGEEETKEKSKLSDLTDSLSQNVTSTYSEGEEELNKISDQLVEITTTTDFFEQEKIREKMRREADKAQSIREAMAFGETVSTRDRNWLSKYDEAMAAGQAEAFARGTFGKAYVELDAKAEANQQSTDNSEPSVASQDSGDHETSLNDSLIENTNDELMLASENQNENLVHSESEYSELSNEENEDEEESEYHPDMDLALELSDEDEEELG